MKNRVASISMGSLPRRYAKALIQLATEQKQVEKFGACLRTLVDAFHTSPDSLAILSSELIRYDDRQRALAEIADKIEAPESFKSFLLVLLKKERIVYLSDIEREYQRYEDETLGRVRVTVITPTMPDDDLLRRIEKILSVQLKKEVLSHGEARPEMLGGVILKANHTIYDGSVRRELEKLKENILRG